MVLDVKCVVSNVLGFVFIVSYSGSIRVVFDI